MRTLAQVHLINAEALVQLLKTDGVQLGDSPIPPEDTTKLRPKRYDDHQINFGEIPEWVSYCEWIKSLSDDAVQGFQRAAQIGVELSEAWIVVNAAVYLWNYTNHMLTQERFREVVPIYTPILETLKETGHAGETVLLCDMSNAKAKGLIQPWIPNLTPPTGKVSPSKEKAETTKPEKGGKGSKTANARTSVNSCAVDPEGTSDLKQAIEVLENALNITNGADLKNLVPISVRQPLIKSWVFCKQLLSHQIPKNLGHDDENPQSQGPMSKALCAVEMLTLSGNGLPDFNPCPTLQEVVRMVETCQWSDRLVELEMWSRLAVLAFNSDNHALVMQCGQKAVTFAENNQCFARKQLKKQDSVFQHKLVVEQEMLYYVSVVMGQSLMKNMMGKNEIRRDALICFVNACRFGQKAGTYDLVITAARHYWNAIKPFIGKPMERELLKEPLEAVLECIACVASKGIGKEEEEEEEETEIPEKSTMKKTVKSKTAKEKEKENESKKAKQKDKKGNKGKSPTVSEKSNGKDDQGKTKSPTETEGKPLFPTPYDEDLKLRAAMYGVLFQAYADKCEWEKGLRAMDQAVKHMPKTHHRLLIFKHRVITKAKLGRPVTFDMGKFKDENEEVISSMWRHVALNSKDPVDQLSAYQNAIEVLESPQSDWQKAEYLIELGEWLFVNEFPVLDAMDQFLWAADIMLNRKSSQAQTPDINESDCDSDDEASKYVPKKKSSVIGMRPSEDKIKVDEITNVRQLEMLTRIHIMIAQIAGRSSPLYKDFVLLACAFVQRIWQVSLFSAEKLQKDGGKPGETVSPKSKKGDKAKEVKESQSKAEKLSNKSCIPSSFEGWSTFEVPEKIEEFFKCDITNTMVNKSTFQKPMLSVYYLEVLLDDLAGLGFHQLGLPVLALIQYLTDVIIRHSQLSKLMHLRALELCQELNLIAGVAHHEKSAGRMLLDEQEQSRSREEIEMWKEEQRQVKAEEERTKTSTSVVFDIKTNSSNLIRPQPTGKLERIEDDSRNKHKIVLSGVKDREVWTKQAEILIRQGHYTAARQLLNEANLSARAFDDKLTLSKVLTHLAVLALAESNWGQAFYLLLEAQKLQGDQKFWLTTTLLLAEAVLSKKSKHSVSLCEPDSQAKEKALGLLMHAKATFQELAEDNPNKANMADYIEAILRARLGTMLSEDLLQDPVSRKRQNAFKDLENACQHLSHASESLLQLGYKREAVKVMVKHATIKKLFVEESYTLEEKHDSFLEVLQLLRSAVTVADEVLYEVLSASSLELKNLSLPVQREAVKVRHHLADHMIDLYVQFSHEDKARRMQEARKGSVEKLIDEFVRADSILTDKEKKWRHVTRTLNQEILMQLSVAHSLSGSMPYLKGKTMLLLGRCLRVLASHTSPDDEDHWKEIEQINAPEPPKDFPNQRKQSYDTEEHIGVEDGNQAAQLQQPSKDVQKRIKNALRLKLTYSNSKTFLTQGVECLAQCVQLGLRSGFRDLVEKASFELVECIGFHDCSTSVQYLALAQSCHMSQVLEEVLKRVQVDPSVSRQAALLYQRQSMSSLDFLNEQNCTVMDVIQNSLADCEAWKRLQVMKQHLELTKEFSSTNNRFIMFQHSQDRRWLYGAVLDKGRSAVSSGKANKQSGNVQAPSRVMIARAKVNPEDLEKLIKEFKIFRSETASELLRRDYVETQHAQRRKMLHKLEETPYPDRQIVDDPLAVEREKQLEAHFRDVTIAMECYLAEVMSKLRPAFECLQMSDAVVLLADEWLLQLPLEAMELLRVPKISSLSRDFSLQIHYYRLRSIGSGSDSKTEARKGGKKDSKGKPETAKKSDKKGTKEIGGGLSKDGLVTDIHGLRYIVDAYDECGEAGQDSPAAVITELITKHKSFTQKWEGIMGANHLPSFGEWQRLLSECSVFMYYGTERCLGSFPPSLLSPMNLSECHAALLLDLVQTNKSFLRQGRDDAAKTVSNLALEQPLETAMLFSLVGVGCVTLNQWHCRLTDTRLQATTYMNGFLEENKTIGQAVRQLIDFAKPTESVAEVETNGAQKGGEVKNEAVIDDKKSAGTGPVQTQDSYSPPRRWFNTVMYGTGNVALNSGKA